MPDKAVDGILFRPYFDEVIGNVLRARGLLVAAHAKGLHLQERRPLALPRPAGRPPHGLNHGQHIVAVHPLARQTVSCSGISDPFHRHSRCRRRGEAISVVFDDKDDRQLPDGGQVDRLVEVAFARGAISTEDEGNEVVALELRGLSEPTRHRQHRCHVRDHPDDAALGEADVKRAIAPLGEASRFAHELAEERLERHSSRGPDAQVAVRRQDVIPLVQRPGTPHRNGLLPVSAEPLGKAILTDQAQHFILNGPRRAQGAVQGC